MIRNEKTACIKFHYLTPFFSFRYRTVVKRCLVTLFRKEKIRFKIIDYIFCQDDYLLEINKTFLNHNDLTDIITFDLSADRKEVWGEIYISIERVRENAGIFKTSFRVELTRVIFHGALHLCGYSDQTPEAKSLMRLKEDQYIELLKGEVNLFHVEQKNKA